MNKLTCLLLALGMLISQVAQARNAEIMMIPTRVVLEKNDRFSTVIVKNVGDAAGNFTLDLIDMKMEESGMVVPYGQGETPAFSAGPFLHIAPKSMTLEPGETQNVRLLVRKPENMEPGEYRSHLQVRLVNENADTPANTSEKDALIAVRANLVVIIPVILRNGETTLTMGIERPKLARSGNGDSLDMYLTRAGTRSSMGDITVTWYPPYGAPKILKIFRGVAVYRPTARRFISVPLDETPKGVNLSQGKLGVVYAAQEKEGRQKLAETEISLR